MKAGRCLLSTRECFGVRESELAGGLVQRGLHVLWWGARGPQHVLNSPRKRYVQGTAKDRKSDGGGKSVDRGGARGAIMKWHERGSRQ